MNKKMTKYFLYAVLILVGLILSKIGMVNGQENFTPNYFLSYYNQQTNTLTLEVVENYEAYEACVNLVEYGHECTYADGLVYTIVLSYSETPNDSILDSIDGFYVTDITVNPEHNTYTESELYNSALELAQNIMYIFSGNLELAFANGQYPIVLEQQGTHNKFYVEYPNLLVSNVQSTFTVFLPLIVK